jgi:transcriptional regulator with XRE-family HTH domain
MKRGDRKKEIKNPQLGAYVRKGRESRGLNLVEAAEASGLDRTYWRRLEDGRYGLPSPKALEAVARVIDCAVDDLYALAGYEPSGGLPTLKPYLRAKYHLPPEAIDQLEGYFAFLRSYYGILDDEPVFPPKPKAHEQGSEAEPSGAKT